MIGKRLRAARKAAKMSQIELAVKAGLSDESNSKISHYETERYNPPFNVTCTIARVLNVPECYFFCRDDWLAENIIALYRNNRRFHLSPAEINELEVAGKQLEEVAGTVKRLLNLRLDLENEDILPGSLKA